LDVTKVFLDTNILVYAVDRRDQDKCEKALGVVNACIRDGTGVISTQVLQEFAAVTLTKLRQSPEVVVAELSLLETLEVVQITPTLVRRGLELHVLHRIHYWDATIVAAAEAARCTLLWSEDFPIGSTYGLLRVENPLAE
jgi:predicted nucleic acid-binding protein